MIISIIVAVAANNVIGKDNQLLWHLPSDLKYFKQRTTNHHILMGRKTYESIGKPLPDRTSLIITQNKNYQAQGSFVFTDIQKAIEHARADNENELFIIGGAQIYALALPFADKLYLTKIHAPFEGDTFFPQINSNEWTQTSIESFEPDEKNKFKYDFIELKRNKSTQ